MIRYDILRENIPCEELFRLMKDSFQERKDQGLNFTVLEYELENLKKLLDVNPVVVAFDENPQTGEREYLGFQIVKIEDKEAVAGILAVSPKCKRTGIGSKIEEITQQFVVDEGCEYMLSNTSEEAISSVKWHLRNNYFKQRIGSYDNTNYYTVFFRKQLKRHWFWSNKALRTAYFNVYSFLYKLYRKKDGSLTAPGKLLGLFGKTQ